MLACEVMKELIVRSEGQPLDNADINNNLQDIVRVEIFGMRGWIDIDVRASWTRREDR